MTEADFDEDGAFWFLTANIVGLGTWVDFAAYRVDDLEDGTWVQTSTWTLLLTDPGAAMRSLAILAHPPLIEVPALGGPGLAALALLISGAGLAALRRRSST